AEVRVLDPTISDIAFAFADADANGVLSLQEVLAVWPVLGVDLLALLDVNSDGYLELAEFGGALTQELFDLIDVNGNGYFDCGDLPPIDKQADPAGLGRVIVLISNLNLGAANSVYVSASRPPAGE
ncbi:MAG TPA: hypothetical protein PKL84_04980, partial [Candidatus Hydrogenedentes bacterium]|nr:hypothetical protein [Candidatus Hydrogenedentota bacterium]